MAELCEASRLHEKQGKHCSQAAEIWHYDTLQAESESAAMWHINLKKTRAAGEANEKINTKAALQHLAKEANICAGVMERSWNIMEIIHPLLAAVCHVKTVSANSCTLCAHNLSSMQSSAERDFPKRQWEKPLRQQLLIDKPTDKSL